MAEIKSIYRGNGITELYVVEGAHKTKVTLEKKKRSRVFAWAFLIALCVDILLGLVVAPFTTESTAFYVLYWTQVIALCGLWLYAQVRQKKTPA